LIEFYAAALLRCSPASAPCVKARR